MPQPLPLFLIVCQPHSPSIKILQFSKFKSALITSVISVLAANCGCSVEQLYCSLGGQTCVADRYEVTDIGTLGGSESYAYAINNAGQIAGCSDAENGQSGSFVTHAFLWQNGQMTDLGTLGGDTSTAYDINDSSHVVGVSQIQDGNQHAFLWQNGQMTDLGTLGGDTSTAYGINNSSHVVGVSQLKDGSEHAFLWLNDQMIDLGTLGGETSTAYGINDSSHVVGVSQLKDGNEHAFLLLNDQMIDLGTLGGDTSTAHDINDVGQIVGSSSSANGAMHAFMWANGVMTGLGARSLLGSREDLDDIVTDDATSLAAATNVFGYVVGHMQNYFIFGNLDGAFLYRQGEMIELTETVPLVSQGPTQFGRPWSLTHALDINDGGQIVGYGFISGRHDYNYRAFMLNP